jgi:hypothetical protein
MSLLEHDPSAIHGPMRVTRSEELEHRHLKSAGLQPIPWAAFLKHWSAQVGSWATSPGRSIDVGMAVTEEKVGVLDVDCADASAANAATAMVSKCIFTMSCDLKSFLWWKPNFLRQFPRPPER